MKLASKEELRLRSGGVDKILTDVKHMKSKQDGITGKLENIQRYGKFREIGILFVCNDLRKYTEVHNFITLTNKNSCFARHYTVLV